MKKRFLAGAALATFGLVGTAYASMPIKLELGGSAQWLFGVSTQSKDFKKDKDYSSTDVKGNNYLRFDGETELDNGMKVGFHASFRAGGNSNSRHNASIVNESWVYAEGRLGKLLIGNNDNPAYLLHVSAPDAAGLSEDAGLGMMSGRWVGVPADFGYFWTTGIDATSTTERIMYFTPKIAGFTFAAGFTSGADNYRPEDRSLGNANENYSLGANYSNVFSGKWRLDASLGWNGGQGLHTSDYSYTSGRNIDSQNEYSAGLKVGYDAFTFGGGVRYMRLDVAGDDRIRGHGWIVGGQYDFDEKVVPLSLSLNYFTSNLRYKPRDEGRDRAQNVNLSAKYQLGAGVKWITTLGYLKFDSTRDTVGDNKGWAAITGLGLSF